MHIPRNVVLFLSLTSSSLVTAIPQFSNRAPPTHVTDSTDPFPVIQQHHGQLAVGFWTKLRDSIIESLWDVPKQENGPARNKPPSVSTAPSTLRARYGDDVVLRFFVESEEEVKALAEASNVLFLDVWSSTNEWVDIRLAKDVVPPLLGLLPKSLQTAHVPLIHDLAQTIYESYPTSPSTISYSHRAFSLSTHQPSDVTNIFFRDYQPLSVIVPWMRLLASLFSSHVQLITVGTSSEGRDIKALRVGVRPINSEQETAPRRTIVIAGGLHAREWISVSTVNYVAYSLITGYGKVKHITKLLEGFDWILIPTMNPDGYVYTWQTDRLWRKNRQQTSLQFCPGLDLDRSWGFAWDGEPTQSNPCSENFAGDEPFEAIESKSIAEWAKNEVETNNVKFVGYLDLHSYSQQILYPYSYSCSYFPPALENLQELAIGMTKAIRLTHREYYSVSSACNAFVSSDGTKIRDQAFPYIGSRGGSALDWFYHELDARYAYQIQLRDKGSYGFLLPKEDIIPTGQEIFNAVTTMGKFIARDKALTQDWEDVVSSPENAPSDDETIEFEPNDNLEETVLRTQGTEDTHNIHMLQNDKVQEHAAWGFRRQRK